MWFLGGMYARFVTARSRCPRSRRPFRSDGSRRSVPGHVPVDAGRDQCRTDRVLPVAARRLPFRIAGIRPARTDADDLHRHRPRRHADRPRGLHRRAGRSGNKGRRGLQRRFPLRLQRSRTRDLRPPQRSRRRHCSDPHLAHARPALSPPGRQRHDAGRALSGHRPAVLRGLHRRAE